MTDSVLLENEKKHIKGKEFILYLRSVYKELHADRETGC